MIGHAKAIVGDLAGVTRDYKEELLELKSVQVQLIDTAGLKSTPVKAQDKKIIENTLKIIRRIDIILFVVDGRVGVTLEDKELFQYCRKLNKPTLLIINKVETPKIEKNALEDTHYFGSVNVIYVSAEHRLGLQNLMSTLEKVCNENDFKFTKNGNIISEKKPINLAVVGRPNVGKSTLINSIIKQERFVTGPESGLTRDSNFVFFKWNDDFFKIYDTAGARKKRKIDNFLEKASVRETLRAINFAHIVILVLEPDDLLNSQDLKLASLCEREGRAIIFAVNKIDRVLDRNAVDKQLKLTIEKSLPKFKGTHISFVSGLKRTGLSELHEHVMKAYANWNFKQATSVLNTWLSEKLDKHAPPMNRERKRIKLKYIVQSNSRPPTIKIFTSHNGVVSKSYKKYLENALERISSSTVRQ